MEPTPKEGLTKVLIKRKNFNLRRGSQSQIKTKDVSLRRKVKNEKDNEGEPVKYKAPFQKSSTPSTLTSLKSSTSSKIELPTKKAIKWVKRNTIHSAVKNLEPLQQKKEKKEIEFPKISWNDFQGQPQEGMWYCAVISWGISYTTKITNRPFQIEVSPICYVIKSKSWVKHKDNELLKHEQGHFNVGCLCALTFKKRVKEYPFLKESYKEDLIRILKETMREFCIFEKKYDDETEHMIDRAKQEEWEMKLKQKLQELREFL